MYIIIFLHVVQCGGTNIVYNSMDCKTEWKPTVLAFIPQRELQHQHEDLSKTKHATTYTNNTSSSMHV